MAATVLIPSKHLKRNGKVDVWDVGPSDEVEFKAWEEQYGGPVRVEQWAVDARHSLSVEPKRYKLTLPKGDEPGRYQKDLDAQAATEGEAQEAADPHYGQGKTA